MHASDFLRRLSNYVFNWPKIDDSPLVFPTKETAIIADTDTTTTPVSFFCPLILLTLMQEDNGVVGSKVIQDVDGSYSSVWTKQDMNLSNTPYGLNYLWTNTVRKAAKSLVLRGLIVIADKDQWQITPTGMECGRRIYAGENEAWLSYDSFAEVVTNSPVSALPVTNPALDLESGMVLGTKFFRADGTESLIPAPKFTPLGRTSSGAAYHSSLQVNVLALWFLIEEFGGVVSADLLPRVSSWYEGKLTEHDNADAGSGKTHFKRHVSNLTHDLKRQHLITQENEASAFHITSKGVQAIVNSLKKHGIPA